MASYDGKGSNGAHELDDASTKDLVREMAAVARSLVKEEVRLAKLELSEERERVQGLASDGKSLFGETRARLRNDLALAKAELSEDVSTAKKGTIPIAAGGVLLHASLYVLLFGIAFALATFLPLWAATLITAALAAGGGYFAIRAGTNKLKELKNPFNRTQRRLKEDAQWLKNSAATLRWSASETMRDARSRMTGIVSRKSLMS